MKGFILVKLFNETEMNVWFEHYNLDYTKVISYY